MSFKITDLLKLRLYLEKFGKITSIDNYTYSVVKELWNLYKEYVKDAGGKDISHPGLKLKF